MIGLRLTVLVEILEELLIKRFELRPRCLFIERLESLDLG